MSFRRHSFFVQFFALLLILSLSFTQAAPAFALRAEAGLESATKSILGAALSKNAGLEEVPRGRAELYSLAPQEPLPGSYLPQVPILRVIAPVAQEAGYRVVSPAILSDADGLFLLPLDAVLGDKKNQLLVNLVYAERLQSLRRMDPSLADEIIRAAIVFHESMGHMTKVPGARVKDILNRYYGRAYARYVGPLESELDLPSLLRRLHEELIGPVPGDMDVNQLMGALNAVPGLGFDGKGGLGLSDSALKKEVESVANLFVAMKGTPRAGQLIDDAIKNLASYLWFLRVYAPKSTYRAWQDWKMQNPKAKPKEKSTQFARIFDLEGAIQQNVAWIADNSRAKGLLIRAIEELDASVPSADIPADFEKKIVAGEPGIDSLEGLYQRYAGEGSGSACRLCFATGSSMPLYQVLEKGSIAQTAGGYDGHGQAHVTEVRQVGPPVHNGVDIVGRFLVGDKREGRAGIYGAKIEETINQEERAALVALVKDHYREDHAPADIQYTVDHRLAAVRVVVREGNATRIIDRRDITDGWLDHDVLDRLRRELSNIPIKQPNDYSRLESEDPISKTYKLLVPEELERQLKEAVIRALGFNPANVVSVDLGWTRRLQAQVGVHQFELRKSGIAHNRWGTGGAPSRKNSHPFFVRVKLGDKWITVALVHNGNYFGFRIVDKIIETYFKDRLDPSSKSSDVDSESFTRAVALMLAKSPSRPHEAVPLGQAMDRALRLTFTQDDLRNTVDLVRNMGTFSEAVQKEVIATLQQWLDQFPVDARQLLGTEAQLSEKIDELVVQFQRLLSLAVYDGLSRPWTYDADQYVDLQGAVIDALERGGIDPAQLSRVKDAYFGAARQSTFAVAALSDQGREVVVRKGRQGGGLIVAPPDLVGDTIGASETHGFEMDRGVSHPDPDLASFGLGQVSIQKVGELKGVTLLPGRAPAFSDVNTGHQIQAGISMVPIDLRNVALNPVHSSRLAQEIFLQRETWDRTLRWLVKNRVGPNAFQPTLRDFNYSDAALATVGDWALVGTGTSKTTVSCVKWAFQGLLSGDISRETGRPVRIHDQRSFEAGQQLAAALAVIQSYATTYKTATERPMVSAVSQGGETEEVKQFLKRVADINSAIDNDMGRGLIPDVTSFLYTDVLDKLASGSPAAQDAHRRIQEWSTQEQQQGKLPTVTEAKEFLLYLARLDNFHKDDGGKEIRQAIGRQYRLLDDASANKRILIVVITNVPGSTVDELAATYTIDAEGEVVRIPHSVYPLNTFEHSVAASSTMPGNTLGLYEVGLKLGHARGLLTPIEVSGINRRLLNAVQVLREKILIEKSDGTYAFGEDLENAVEGIVRQGWDPQDPDEIAGLPQLWYMGSGLFSEIGQEGDIKGSETLRQSVQGFDLTAGSHGRWPALRKDGKGLLIIFAPAGSVEYDTAIQKLREGDTRIEEFGTVVAVTDSDVGIREGRIRDRVDVEVALPLMGDPLTANLMSIVFLHMVTLRAAEKKYGLVEKALTEIRDELEQKGILKEAVAMDVLKKFAMTVEAIAPRVWWGKDVAKQFIDQLRTRFLDKKLPPDVVPLYEEAWREKQKQTPYPKVALKAINSIMALGAEKAGADLLAEAQVAQRAIQERIHEYEKAVEFRRDLAEKGVDVDRLDRRYARLVTLGIFPAIEIQCLGPTYLSDMIDFPPGIAKYVAGVLAGTPVFHNELLTPTDLEVIGLMRDAKARFESGGQAPAPLAAAGLEEVGEWGRAFGDVRALGPYRVTKNGAVIGKDVDLNAISGQAKLGPGVVLVGPKAAVESGAELSRVFVEDAPVHSGAKIADAVLVYDPNDMGEEWELAPGSPFRVASRPTVIGSNDRLSRVYVHNAAIGHSVSAEGTQGYVTFVAHGSVGVGSRLVNTKSVLAVIPKDSVAGNFDQDGKVTGGLVEITDFVGTQPGMRIGQAGRDHFHLYGEYYEGYFLPVVVSQRPGVSQQERRYRTLVFLPAFGLQGDRSIMLEFSGTVDPGSLPEDKSVRSVRGKGKSGHGVLAAGVGYVMGGGSRLVGALDYGKRQDLNTTQNVVHKNDRTYLGSFAFIPAPGFTYKDAQGKEHTAAGEAWGRVGNFSLRADLSPREGEVIGWVLDHAVDMILSQMAEQYEQHHSSWRKEGQSQFDQLIQDLIATEIDWLNDEKAAIDRKPGELASEGKTDPKLEQRKAQIVAGVQKLQDHLVSGAWEGTWKVDSEGRTTFGDWERDAQGHWVNKAGKYQGSDEQYTIDQLLEEAAVEYPRQDWYPPFTQADWQKIDDLFAIPKEGRLAGTIHPKAHVDPLAIVEEGASVDAGAVIGPGVVIGKDAVVGPGAEILFSRVEAGAGVGHDAKLYGVLVETGSRVDPGAKLRMGIVGSNGGASRVGEEAALAFFKVDEGSSVGQGTTGAVTSVVQGSQVGAKNKLLAYSRVEASTTESNQEIGGRLKNSRWDAKFQRDAHAATDIRNEIIDPYWVRRKKDGAHWRTHLVTTHGAYTNIDGARVSGAFFAGKSVIRNASVTLAFVKGVLESGAIVRPLTFSWGPGLDKKELGGVLNRLGFSYVYRHILDYAFKTADEEGKKALQYLIEAAAVDESSWILDQLEKRGAPAELSRRIRQVLDTIEADFLNEEVAPRPAEVQAQIKTQLNQLAGELRNVILTPGPEWEYSNGQLLQGLSTFLTHLDGRWRLRYSPEEGLVFTEGTWGYDEKRGKWSFTHHVAAGLEELGRAAAFIRQHGLVQVAAGVNNDADVVRAYLQALWPQRESEIPQGLSVARPYHAGPLWGAPEAKVWQTYPKVELFSGLDKVLGAVAEQVGVSVENLHPEALKAFYQELFDARDADGYLVRGQFSEITIYQLAYRPDILWPLLKAVADQTVDRAKLQQALANPFRGTNDSGNDAMARTIDGFLKDLDSGFTDDPAWLRQDSELLIPWIRLLAANLADATRPEVWDEIQETGNLSDYFKKWLRTPFLKALHGERDVRAFISRVREPNHTLLFFPDNNLELAADLKMAEVLLSASPTLRILFVPKRDNGVMNDASVQDTERLLNPTGPAIYARLRQYAQEEPSRFVVLPGPAVQGLPLHLMPPEVVKAVKEADSILAIGEANTYTLNGLRHEYIYLGLRLKWWEVVGERVFTLSEKELAKEGLKSADRPPVFVRADGSKGPYYQADLREELFSTIHQLPAGHSATQGGLEEATTTAVKTVVSVGVAPTVTGVSPTSTVTPVAVDAEAAKVLILAPDALSILEAIPSVGSHGGRPVPIVAIAQDEKQQAAVEARVNELGIVLAEPVIDVEKTYGDREKVGQAIADAEFRYLVKGWGYKTAFTRNDLLGIARFLGIPEPEGFVRAAQAVVEEAISLYL